MHTPGRPLRNSLFLVLLSAFVLSGPAGARSQSPERALLQPRITERIDESRLVRLRGNTHPLAQPRYDAGPAPVSMPANRLILVLSRSAQQEADLQVYLQSLQDAASPNYHRYLSADEFGQRFGVGDEDLQAVATWLAGHGFSIAKVFKGRTALEFSGTVAQVQAAFHTAIHRYVIGEEQHWANASDPLIPSALAPVVAGLASLNSFAPRAQNTRGPDGAYDAASGRIKPAYTTGTARTGYYLYVTPADAATIYDTPTRLNPNLTGTALDGTGVTIGIAGDSNINLTQNANYRATFGLAAKPTSVIVDGNDPGLNGDAMEAYLDTQVAGGIAPNANVILYTAANTDLNHGLFLAIQRALDDNQADILNVSFGGCESAQGAAGNQYILNLWEQAAAQGIAVTVASGDSGSAGCDNPKTETTASGPLAVNGFASTPYNIAVGGTDYDTLYSGFPASFTEYVDVSDTQANHRSALKYIPEEPWNNSTISNGALAKNTPWDAEGRSQLDNIEAGGGGVSNCVQGSGPNCTAGYPLPTWQSGFATDKSGRNLPDVSLLAGNGLYGAVWGICTDLEVYPSGAPIPNCTPGANSSNFNLTGVGGTSAAAPAFAGILALVQQKTGSRLGQADYTLYDLAGSHYSAVFHDVTTGNNSVECNQYEPGCSVNSAGHPYMSGFNAVAGYDEASGLGSVDAAQLVNNWSSASRAATTATLQLNGASTPLTITHGKSVTVNASVTSAKGTPPGVVGLVDSLSAAALPGNEGLDLLSLNPSGIATGTIDSLPGGHYSVSAHYGGSSAYAESASNAVPVTVAPESSTTLLSISAQAPATSAVRPLTYGYYSFLDAQPYGSSSPTVNGTLQPNGIPSGTVTFKDGTATLGTASLDSSGVAELATTALPAGTYNVTASFPGDASFKASTSAAQAVTVQPAATVVDIPVSSVSAAVMGKPVTLSTKLWADSLGNPPTGAVTFNAGSTPVAQAPVTGIAAAKAGAPLNGNYLRATAQITTTTLPVGINVITPSYGGDGNYSAGTNQETTTVEITGSGTLKPAFSLTQSPVQAYTYEPLNLTVKFTGPTGKASPTGPVYLTMPVLGTGINDVATLKSGSATFTLPAYFSLSSANATFYYPGDANYAPSSDIVPIQMNEVTPTVTISPASGSLQSTQSLNVGIKVAGSIAGTPPTGYVVLGSSGSQSSIPNITLANGQGSATLPPGYLGLGNDTLTATYLGDRNYESATGTATFKVTGLPATVTATASPNPVSANQPFNIVVTVNGGKGNPSPSGYLQATGPYYNEGSVSGGQGVLSFPAKALTPGTYTFSIYYDGGGVYTPSTTSCSVTVTAAAANVSVASGSSQSTVYGSAFAKPLVALVTDANKKPLSGVTVYYSPAGVNLASSSAVTGSNGQASISAVATGTGSLTVNAGVDNIQKETTFSLTGTKAPLTMTANNISVKFNQPIPALTFTTTGLVNGDTQWTVGWPIITTAAKQGSSPGTYPITLGTGSMNLQNYTLTTVQGTLTITN